VSDHQLVLHLVVHVVEGDVTVALQQRPSSSPAELQGVDGTLGVASTGDRNQHRAGQPGHLHRGGEVGERAVARADEDSGVGPGRDAVDQRSGDLTEIDVTEPGGVNALGGADARVELFEEGPREPPGGTDRQGRSGAVTQMRERLPAQGRGESCLENRGGVEGRDDLRGLQGAHRRTAATRSAKPAPSA
jgi:hypothetical protein